MKYGYLNSQRPEKREQGAVVDLVVNYCGPKV
jgi:hypothetical protein